MAEQMAAVAEQGAQIEELHRQVDELERQANRDSGNISVPASLDPP